MKSRAIAVLLLLGAMSATKEVGADSLPRPERPSFTASRAEISPVIDGRLDDAIWKSASAITGFTQRDPEEGKPASERTMVWVAYDDSALYIAARLHDSAPVTTRLGRRDSSLASDWFRVWLDPHYDRQTGVSFWVNPSNVQIDMVLFNDGWDDWDWDAVWESATSIDEDGWTVEMRIPYSQLRFPHREEHVWGVNFGRRIDRNNEEARLVHIPKTETGFVSRFADLVGIHGVRPGRSLEIVPYAVSRADFSGTVSPDNPFRSSSEASASAGVDIRYGITSNLTLTGTINPDFGQVEVDPARVNLSQYELFFPEKRPFFVEGSSLFRFGQGGSNNNFGFNIGTPNFFYSRRIGRSPQGVRGISPEYVDGPGDTTILGAAKLTGRFGDGWSVGVLNALTDEEKARFQLDGEQGSQVVEPKTNYFVGRLAKELSPLSRVGVLFTAVNRDLPDELDGSMRSGAYTGGIDGHRFFGEKDVIWEWFVVGSRVEGSEEAIAATQRSSARYFTRPDAGHVEFDPSRGSLDGWGASTMVASQTGNWRYNVKVQSFSPGFETNDVGFMTRTDVVTSHAALMYRNTEPNRLTRDRSVWIAKYQHWNHDGDRIADGIYTNANTRFNNYWYTFASGGTEFERRDDRLTRGGPVVNRPASYHGSVGFGSDSRKPVFFETWGGGSKTDDGGWSHNLGLYLTWKPTSNLNFNVTPRWSRSHDVVQYVTTVPDATATATFGRRYVFAEIDQRNLEIGTRLDWTYSPALSFQLYIQPFVASGDYSRFKELARPRSLDYLEYGDDTGSIVFDEAGRRYTVDPDGAGPAIPFSFGNPDFNFRSLRGSAVVRWEYRPGSSVYLVWNENRSDFENIGDFRSGRDLRAAAKAPADDVFMIKFSYWLAM
jgi:hypothetical protein